MTNPALLTLANSMGDDLFSTANLTTMLNSPGTNATQHYGPYASTSTDSGTCGADWATDTFDRHFTVQNNHDGTFNIVEQFKNGSFVTMAGPSPARVNSPSGGTVLQCNRQMHGISSSRCRRRDQTSTSRTRCVNMTDANCTTATVINTHFTPAATRGHAR